MNFPLRFLYPEVFLLALPLWFAWRKWGQAPGVTGWLRALLLLVVLTGLAGPEIDLGGRGIDILVLADRSRSMSADSRRNVRELIQNLENQRGPGDRIGLVTVGAEALLEHGPSAESRFESYNRPILPDGSDLASAIETALSQVSPRRPARLLILSDGEFTGEPPQAAARRAREAGVPVDFRHFDRLRAGDVAVQSLELPDSTAPREPFQFTVWIHSERATTGTVEIRRDDEIIATAERTLSPGLNRLQFRDLIDTPGFVQYSASVQVEGDPLPENNRGLAGVRVEAGPRLLVLNADGQPDNFVRAMEAGRIAVDVRAAATHPLTQDSLDPYRAVVVENVPAADLGRLRMERLGQFVEDLGGGLLVTGGKRSFGTGGYFKSPLEELLPVSMELREEHRKSRVAIAVALDRSGSMAVPVSGGRTKMDLANLGTAECIRLLSPGDMIAVIAVDSSPHVIQPLTPVDSPEALVSKVKQIESMGGGIFVEEALVAAGQELMKAADYSTRHIILFSDAADSEEPGDYRNILKKYEAAGITCSVIGLGTKADPDAALLEEIAKLGSGNVMFTQDPEELPRLFTQDTMSVARNTFITSEDGYPDGIPGELLPDARLMGEFAGGNFPRANGYNLCYLRPEATMAVISHDDYQAPWSAFWYRGLGRVSAITLEVDGQYSGQFGRWEGYEDFLITHARWLLGGSRPDDAFLTVEQEGQDARVVIELDPERAGQGNDTPELYVVPPGAEAAETVRPDLIWTGPDTLEARFRLDRTGNWRTLLKTGPRQLTRGPAVALPYSPEFMPRQGLPSGRETLLEVARLSGGEERADILDVLRNPPRTSERTSLLPWVFGLSIFLLVLEIAGRRLSLWERAAETFQTPAPQPGTDVGRAAPVSWLPQWKIRRPKRKAEPVSVAESAGPPAETRPTSSEPATPSSVDVWEQARQRARDRFRN